MSDFLHGIEHINEESDSVIINDIFTAVIGLVGTADKGERQKLTLCMSAKDDAQFGTKGTIPEALKAIRMQDSSKGSALVFVVSVGSDTDEITGGKIVGEVEATGLRTGMQLFETALGEFGYEPMIYIAPGYSALDAVKQEFKRIMEITEAVGYIDLPDGYSFTDAIQSRAANGDFSGVGEGVKLCYPKFNIPNPEYVPPADGEEPKEDAEPRYLTRYMSAYFAGLRAKVDLEEGWHVSSSNHDIIGVESMTEKLTFSLTNKSCEVNQLNATGITTAVNMDGIKEWGNRIAGFPSQTSPVSFECVRRGRAIMKRAITKASQHFLDRNVSQANIDLTRNSANKYFNRLVKEGKIIYGQCFYKQEHQTEDELASGIVTFDFEYCPAIPMGNMKFRWKLDTSKLLTLK